jgi:hypothetical protein
MAKDLLPLMSTPALTTKVLKILHFVNFPSTDMSVALMHRTVQESILRISISAKNFLASFLSS